MTIYCGALQEHGMSYDMPYVPERLFIFHIGFPHWFPYWVNSVVKA
jgi:hypothetical protein